MAQPRPGQAELWGGAVAAELVLKTLGIAAGAAKWEFPLGIPGRRETSDTDERASRLIDAVHNHQVTATRVMIDAAVDDLRRRRERGLDRAQVDLLRAVMDDPQHLLPQSELVPGLLERFLLLPYPDGHGWYYPHPLLTLNLLRG